MKKNNFDSRVFLGVEIALFSLVLGLPFVVAGNRAVSWWQTAGALEILALVMLTVLAGLLFAIIIIKSGAFKWHKQ